jgi:hypothetical protein
MWRMNVGAKFWPGAAHAERHLGEIEPAHGWAARAPVPPMRNSE